jgi:hypothetical protein
MSEVPGRSQLVRYLAGELAPDECGVLEGHLEGCPACRDALAEIRGHANDYDAIADEQLSKLMARIASEPGARSRQRWLQGVGLAVVAVGVMLLILFWPGGKQRDVEYKGAFAFKVVAQKTGEQVIVGEGERLRRGDALRFVIATDEDGFLSVFSVDGAGDLSPFYPESDPASQPDPMRIDRAGEHELPESVILDNWVGREYLVVVFSPESFDRRRVHQTAKRLIQEGGPRAIGPASLGVVGAVGVVPIVKVEDHRQ